MLTAVVVVPAWTVFPYKKKHKLVQACVLACPLACLDACLALNADY